ncbi:hypothetical protein FLP10_13310 [Agromyces intestinalis]|uniref:Uncharacterized protein n=1 Tax=Agromyces intestinalis TaxID=2592652 RepID=A0A5C1YIE8_9MICO|nr:hypothetical protein [Agromyces intestinalis]QEO15295.1 hypothetical protein FLP10_13310 [Agromyces intestinalis]
MTQQRAHAGWSGIVLVWAIAVAGSVVVLALAAGGAGFDAADDAWPTVYTALGVVFAAAVLVTLVVQLATRRPEGFVSRASASVGGAAAVVGVAALAAIPFA